MLNVFIYGLIASLVTMIIIAGVGKIVTKELEIGKSIAAFIILFVWIICLLYFSCMEQTIFAIIRWLWIPLIIVWIVFVFGGDEEYAGIIGTLIIISGLFCISNLFTPKQTMIYLHDMEEVDIAYAITSDEILARIQLRTDFRDKYKIDTPRMRKVNGKDIAVYPVRDKKESQGGEQSEYIPGYAIQEENQLPKFVRKRIYFDTSYENERDAKRRVRKEYPTFIIGAHVFDVDDEWNPYEVFEYRENLYTTNGEDYGLILLDLRDGTCKHYKAAEVPEWVDFKTTEPK